MHKKVKFKGPSGFIGEGIFIFQLACNSGNFYSIEKNKIS